jgi:hypothetical protein
MTNGEITLDDYKLTNIDLATHYFTIRLKDEKEYTVCHKHLDTGEYGTFVRFFIEKDGKGIPLSREVAKIFLREVREYEREGI